MKRNTKPPAPKFKMLAKLSPAALDALQAAQTRLLEETRAELLTCKKNRRATLERTATGTELGLAAVHYELTRRATEAA